MNINKLIEYYHNNQKDVVIQGWIHRIRKQGRNIIFLQVRDGTGCVQVLLNKNIINSNREEVNKLVKETCIKLEGKIKIDSRAPGGFEIICTKFNIIGTVEQNIVQDEYMVLREDRLTHLIKLRHFMYKFIRNFFDQKNFYEITYRSQLHMELLIPVLKNVYCFNGDKFLVECGFMDLEKILCLIEEFICTLSKKFLEDNNSVQNILNLNHNFEILKKPFKRVKYCDIVKTNNFTHFINKIKEPIFLTHFPTHLNPFYIKNSFELLLPNFGQILQGYLKIDSVNELNIDEQKYKWYINHKRCGTSSNGGFELDFKKLLLAFTDQIILDISLW